MAGGLEGRMQKLALAQQAQQLSSPENILRQAGMLQQLVQGPQEQQMRQQEADRQYELAQRGMDAREQGIDYARGNSIVGALGQLGATHDISGPLLDYLRQMGVTGEVERLPEFNLGGGAPEPNEELINLIIQKIQQQNQPAE